MQSFLLYLCLKCSLHAPPTHSAHWAIWWADWANSAELSWTQSAHVVLPVPRVAWAPERLEPPKPCPHLLLIILVSTLLIYSIQCFEYLNITWTIVDRNVGEPFLHCLPTCKSECDSSGKWNIFYGLIVQTSEWVLSLLCPLVFWYWCLTFDELGGNLYPCRRCDWSTAMFTVWKYRSRMSEEASFRAKMIFLNLFSSQSIFPRYEMKRHSCKWLTWWPEYKRI